MSASAVKPDVRPQTKPQGTQIIASSSPSKPGSPVTRYRDQQSALDEATQPLLSLVLPQLHLSDLRNLSLASSGLRALVQAAPDDIWATATANSLPRKFVAANFAPGRCKQTAMEHGHLTALLRDGKKPSLR